MEMTNGLRENIIISADDFGISQRANENILSLARVGKVDRVAVLVDHLLEGKDLADLVGSGTKIDLHLRLKGFDGKMNRSRGTLKRGVLFLWYYFSGKGTKEKVEKEWQGQIEKFISLFGRTPDGINSHQYLHFFPPYFKIILGLGKKYEIPYLRFGKHGISENVNYISVILSWLWKINFIQFEKFYLVSSDFLASYDWIKNFPQFLEKLPPGKTELIFHPERDEEHEMINKYF